MIHETIYPLEVQIMESYFLPNWRTQEIHWLDHSGLKAGIFREMHSAADARHINCRGKRNNATEQECCRKQDFTEMEPRYLIIVTVVLLGSLSSSCSTLCLALHSKTRILYRDYDIYVA